MRYLIYLGGLILICSCQHNLTHEKYVVNNSTQILTVINPDYDTVYTIAPGHSAMIYSFEVLDTKQEKEDCKWLGDTLIIKNEDDSLCDKQVTIEENWTWKVDGPEKERVQTCSFAVTDDDF